MATEAVASKFVASTITKYLLIYFTCMDPERKVHGANMGPTGPRWAPCWPHELCYLGKTAQWEFLSVSVVDCLFTWPCLMELLQRLCYVFSLGTVFIRNANACQVELLTVHILFNQVHNFCA